MTDIVSNVGVQFNASGDAAVLKSLDDVARMGTKTEASLKGAADAERRLAEEAKKASAQVKALQGAGLGLGRQFADVGVSLAGGINPLMVLIQQGPQIADAFAVAKQQGLGFSTVIKGLTASLAPLLPLLAAGAAAAGVIGGAYLVWKKQTDDLAASQKAAAKVAEQFVDVQNSTRSALSSAIDFAEKYKVTNVALTKALDGVLISQNAAYKETLAGIGANDQAGQAAVRRAELERLLTVSILRRAAAEAEARGKEAEAEAKKAKKVASREGLFASIGQAYLGAEGGTNVDPLTASEQATAAKAKQLNIAATEKAAKTELDYAKALKGSADAMMTATLTIPPAKKAREGLSAAEKAATKAAREAAAAEKARAEALDRLLKSLETPAEKAVREYAESTALLRERLDAGKISIDDYREAVERLNPVIVSVKDAQKALSAEFENSPDDLAKGIKGLDDAADKARDLADAFADAQFSFEDLLGSIKSGNVGRLLGNIQGLIASIPQLLAQGPAGIASIGSIAANAIGGKTGRAVGGGLGIAASGLGVGAFAASGIGAATLGAAGLGLGAITGIAALAGPIGIAAGALYAAAKLLNVGGKPSNKGAGFDLVTGQLSGNKRSAETEEAARGAGEAIIGIQDALKAAGIGITDAVTGLVIGTRDQTQIYLKSGRTLLSAVGDSGAAVDTALRAILESATYVSEAQKKLVDSALAAGKGFDAIQEILSKYEAAQGISASLAEAIQQLTDPKAFDLGQVEKNITAQRDSAKKLADEGFITADSLATINGQLDTLRGLQIDDVMRRYGEAVTDAAQAALDAANDNAQQAAGALSEAQQNLIDAYGREADALKATSDRFRDLAANLRQFGATLAGGQGGAGGYQFARAAFLRTSALAQGGDAKALGDLQGVSEAYLTAARAVAPDARAYARDLAAVRNAVEASANVADATATAAEQQLQALHEQVAQLVTLNESVLSVAEAIAALTLATQANAAAQAALLALQTPAEPPTVSAPPASAATTSGESARTAAAIEAQNTLLAEQNALLTEIAKTNATQAATLTRVTRDGESLLTTAA